MTSSRPGRPGPGPVAVELVFYLVEIENLGKNGCMLLTFAEVGCSIPARGFWPSTDHRLKGISLKSGQFFSGACSGIH